MTDIKEKLSALYDGELESSQIDDLLEECRNNDELIRSFSLYGFCLLYTSPSPRDE